MTVAREDGPLLIAVHSAKRQGAQMVALGWARSVASEDRLVIAVGSGLLRNEFAELGSLIREPAHLPLWGATKRRWVIDSAKTLLDAVRLAYAIRRARARAVVVASSVLVSPVLAARLARVPVLVCVHEAPKSAAVRRVFRFHGACADTIIAISPLVTSGFRSARARVVECRVGIHIPLWHEHGARMPGSRVHALLVGTIDEHKRQHVAIEAVASAIRAGADVELEIVGPVGSEPYMTLLRALVVDLDMSDRVRLLGERSDIEQRMRAADVVLVPGGEVTPLTMMEAMALGTPVVAARTGSIEEMVVDEESGLLCDVDNADAMAAAIRRLYDEPRLAGLLAENARRRAEDLFDESTYFRVLQAEIDHLTRPSADESAAREQNSDRSGVEST